VTKYRCRWCGRTFEGQAGPGRPRQYCRASCRQRDYEARRRAEDLGLNEGELVVARNELERLRDRLYVLRSALEDVDRDLAGGDDDDRRRAFDWLLDAARQAVSD
jgi:hypothetical protein